MAVSATFGTVDRDTPGEYQVPLTVAEAVRSLHYSDFDLMRIEGSDVEDFEVILSGTGAAYVVAIVPPVDRMGELSLSLDSNIIKVSDGADDMIIADAISFKYNTTIPEVVDSVFPRFIEAGEQSVLIDFNVPVIGLMAHSFIYEGIDPGQPILYASASITDPEIDRNTPYNDATVPRRYFRLEFTFPNPPPQGTLNIALKENQVCVDSGELVNPPMLPVFPDQMLTVGTPYSASFQITDESLANIIVESLPIGISAMFNAPTLLISGTPTEAGNVQGLVVASYIQGVKIQQSIAFIVSDTGSGSQP